MFPQQARAVSTNQPSLDCSCAKLTRSSSASSVIVHVCDKEKKTDKCKFEKALRETRLNFDLWHDSSQTDRVVHQSAHSVIIFCNMPIQPLLELLAQWYHTAHVLLILLNSEWPAGILIDWFLQFLTLFKNHGQSFFFKYTEQKSSVFSNLKKWLGPLFYWMTIYYLPVEECMKNVKFNLGACQ